jgi:type IV secretory pathway TraG/TraD family ATPase VirD4
MTKRMPLGTANWTAPLSGGLKAFEPGDFFLGESGGQLVGHSDVSHIAIQCGTRGGKGVSLIIPNLCLYPGSVVVIDPKGENAMVTARSRGKGSPYTYGMGQKVHVLDPFHEVKTASDDFADLRGSFNPLDAIRPGKPEATAIAGKIVSAIIIDGEKTEPFWGDSARILAKVTSLHVASSSDFRDDERTLFKVYELLCEGDKKAHQIAVADDPDNAPSAMSLLFMSMTRNHAYDGAVARMGQQMFGMMNHSPKTFQSVLSTTLTNLEFVGLPEMRAVMDKSTFELSDLKTDANGVSVYFSLPERYSETHFRWLRMMITLTICEMERTSFHPRCGFPVLVVLDEFPALQRMKVLEIAAAQIAGYGVKLVFVVQTLPQLKDIYKDNWETLIANAGVRIFFCNDDHFTREYASKLIGECEVVRTQMSLSNTYGHSSNLTYNQSVGSSYGRSGQWSPQGGFSSGWSEGNSLNETRGHSSGYSASRTVGAGESIQKRFLITPDEVGRRFGKRSAMALVLVSGEQPTSVNRLFYYKAESFEGLFDAHRVHALPPRLEVMEARKRARERDREIQRELMLMEGDYWRVFYERKQSALALAKLAAELEAEEKKNAPKGFWARFLAWW